ncbi:MAG: hypothetical protein WA906_14165 [Pacificimonas sp.]
MSCSNCQFFNSSETECRRYAPQPAADDKKAHWPTVSASDWCGEFKEADGARKAA